MGVEVTTDADGDYGTVLLDRPGRDNALGMEEMTAIIDGVELLGGDDDTAAVVLRGRPEVFCSGVCVESISERSDDVDATTALIDRMIELYRTVETCPVPTVAVLEGPATSVGCELALATDLRVASEDAELALDGLAFGMVPPFERLRRIAGESVANDLALTDRRLSAREAAANGLFNRVVPSDAVEECVRSVVDSVADKHRETVAQYKRALRYADGKAVADTTDYRRQLEYVCFTDTEFAERASRHAERRRPDHTGA